MRVERDSMGEMEVPADAYYGASTQRAVLNFPISGQPFPHRFIRALGLVKKTAAQTNGELGLLPEDKLRAIVEAAQEVVDGKLDDQFPIDVYQTGSGTSTNTNANEVIANRATEILGGKRGSKLVHPNDHVNLCQSSNDVIPTAIQVSWGVAIADELIPALQQLQKAIEAKSKEFWPAVKTGRTHLMDATPIRLGQEFKGYAGQIEESIRRAQAAVDDLLRGPGDGGHAALRKQAELAVGLGGCLFDETQGADESPREGLAGDWKVEHGALGRGAVIGVGRDLHLAHGVALDAGPFRHGQILKFH